ncbi:MAG: hypothetical protein KGQ46_12260 [Hyphomicrobiales bacterium]|nr:hypothetical protein [Hyphomicrobiales bacterium]MDE2113867.1 hypothetical protein [Hyphomicrobiales bacterium]
MKFLRPLRFGAKPESTLARPMPNDAPSPELIIRHFVRVLESITASHSGASHLRGLLTREKP